MNEKYSDIVYVSSKISLLIGIALKYCHIENLATQTSIKTILIVIYLLTR